MYKETISGDRAALGSVRQGYIESMRIEDSEAYESYLERISSGQKPVVGIVSRAGTDLELGALDLWSEIKFKPIETVYEVGPVFYGDSSDAVRGVALWIKSSE